MALQAYDWPGNIRELETVIKRYVLSGDEAVIRRSVDKGDLEEQVTEILIGGQTSLKSITRQAAKQVERKLILRTLELHRWNRRVTARALGISYAALLYKLREAGVPPRVPRGQKTEPSSALEFDNGQSS
jgi:DNA-binding NtrC family response regulator